MANFATHIGVGTVASGMLATLTLAADVVAPENLVAVTLAGVLGSVLPDIDLKDSRAGRAMFAGLAAFFSFAVLFTFAEKFSIAELWLLSICTFLFFRFVVHAIFHRMSYHRGIYHSILAGLFFAFVTAIVYYYVLGRHEGVCWLAGGFMFIGYMVHLVLDEIYSVDVLGTRVKRSFGTAVKFYDGRRIDHSIAMAVATVAALMLTPPTKTFVDGMTSRSMWTGLRQRMLPHDNNWFGITGEIVSYAGRGTPAAQPEPAAPIATGSIPQPAAEAPPATSTPTPSKE
ncbi:MAG TPA: metal-dependent hydrolase [Hyphomicrobiaceae bacterium]|nr:metal-dependent hydrolase [Hyphomicrobiaceae bacterium]